MSPISIISVFLHCRNSATHLCEVLPVFKEPASDISKRKRNLSMTTLLTQIILLVNMQLDCLATVKEFALSPQTLQPA